MTRVGKIELAAKAGEVAADAVKGTISIAESVDCLGVSARALAGFNGYFER